MHSRSCQASTWGTMASPVSMSGVHEARISTSARSGSPSIEPNAFDETAVTVPLGATYSAPRPLRASSSQDQPTSASRGSTTMSGSTVARAKVTQRKVPSQAGLPAGSWSRMRRPWPISASSTSTSAEMATANGAIRCGAGISSTISSGRQGMPVSEAAAASNSPDSAFPNATPSG